METEVKYYDDFDEVYIFALQIRKEHLKRKRTVGNNVKVIPIMKASNKTYLLKWLFRGCKSAGNIDNISDVHTER